MAILSTSTAYHQLSRGFRPLEWSTLLMAALPITSWGRLYPRSPQGIPRGCLLHSILYTSFDDSVIIFLLGYVSKCTFIFLNLFSKINSLSPLIIFIDLGGIFSDMTAPVCSWTILLIFTIRDWASAGCHVEDAGWFSISQSIHFPPFGEIRIYIIIEP